MDTNQLRPDHDHAATAERSLARLLKLSGERETPSAEATARAHAAALESWRESLRQTRAKRIRYTLSSLAAVLCIVLIGAVSWSSLQTQRQAPVVVAQIVGLSAPAALIDRNGERVEASIGTPIATRVQLDTQSGRAAIKIGDSLSLRLDKNTQLRFEDDSHVRLLAGAIYIDSGGLNAASNLRVLTPAGEVRHEGTQYQVRVHGALTQIKVREGRVRFLATRDGSAMSIVAGEQVRVDDDVSKSSVPLFGPDWDWASSMASQIDIDNRPLSEFLAWITREHGWQLRYASENEERAVQSIRLHGSAKGDTPSDTLRRVSLITGLSMQVDNGVLLIGPGQEQRR